MTLSEKVSPRDYFHDPPPVFNKRLFRAQAGIVVTNDTLRILRKPLTRRRSEDELHALKSVVSGLKAIHKGLQIIKEALCYCVNYERVDGNVDIRKKREEDILSCYYILSGSVEGKYTVNNDFEGNNNSGCDISYTHVAGEYLGLVSSDGPKYDLPPPDEMRSMEACEFLRIDRRKFHQTVKRVQNRYVKEIEHYINNTSILQKLPDEDKTKMVTLMARQEYQAGRVIINQGDIPEHLFFVAEGRCQYYRKVYIEEVNREELVKLGQVEEGEFFGESTVIDGAPSFCSVASIGTVTCYMINKWAIKTNENIVKVLRDNRHYFIGDDVIKYYIRDSDMWQSYKRRTITNLLNSVGKDRVALGQKDMPEPLSRAVDFGEANRRHSSHSQVHRDETPGAPKPVEQLFVAPRSRRRSSAILTSDAAAVVKAVLLLRRTGDGFQTPESRPKESPDQNSPTSSFVRFPRVKGSLAKNRTSNNTSAARGRFVRQKSAPSTVTLPRHQEIPRCKSVNDTAPSEKSTVGFFGGRDVKSSSSKKNDNQLLIKLKSSPPQFQKGEKEKKNVSKVKNVNAGKKRGRKSRIPLPEQKQKQTSPNLTASDPLHTQTKRNPIEKLEKRNIIIKEIINTGFPGQNGPPSNYRRFPPSMFQLLDEPKSNKGEEVNQEVMFNPWLVGMAVKKWVSTIRRLKSSVKDPEPPPSPSSQTPLIVIEEWVTAEDEEHDKERSMETREERMAEEEMKTTTSTVEEERGKHRKARKTPSPLLSDVREESEDEVKKYEDDDAASEIWYTPIHEARDHSQKQLEDVKKELEAMRRIRSRNKYRAGSGHRGLGTASDGDSTQRWSDSVEHRRKESSENRRSIGEDTKREEEQDESMEKSEREESPGVTRRSLARADSEVFDRIRKKTMHPNSNADQGSSKLKKSKSMTEIQPERHVHQQPSDQTSPHRRSGNTRKTAEHGRITVRTDESTSFKKLRKILDDAYDKRISNYMENHKQESSRHTVQKWI